MEKLNINEFGLIELSQNDAERIQGGVVFLAWFILGIIVGNIVGEVVRELK